MISLLKGSIVEIGNRSVIVDTGHIGYKVFITDDLAHTLKLGTENVFWTHFVVREDTQDLYGFISRKDRDFFELLISVSGIGPKSALNIMSLVGTETLTGAIHTGSTAHLIKVSGIGKKTAEKIVLELKDKLDSFADESFRQEASSDIDAIEALKSLGYDATEAREALKKIDREIGDTGAKVKAALKILS